MPKNQIIMKMPEQRHNNIPYGNCDKHTCDDIFCSCCAIHDKHNYELWEQQNKPKSNDIKTQLEFVAWLKQMSIYNQFDTAGMMVAKQQVWESAKKYYGKYKD